jgi:hypothetical protein
VIPDLLTNISIPTPASAVLPNDKNAKNSNAFLAVVFLPFVLLHDSCPLQLLRIIRSNESDIADGAARNPKYELTPYCNIGNVLTASHAVDPAMRLAVVLQL